MANFAILLIPTSSDYLPSEKQLEDTRLLLESFFESRENDAQANIYPNYKFVTTGAEFETLACPLCNTNIERFEEEYDEWWYEFENQLETSQEPLEEIVTMQCCGKKVSANQFNFNGNALFTKCLIRLYEPGDEPEIDNSELKTFEQVFAGGLKQIIEMNG